MKRLTISSLMDEYTDTEFFPEGGSTADAKAVNRLVLEKGALDRKRRMPRFAQVLLAAALAVVCAFMIAAAGPGRIFQLASGGTASYQQVSENRSVVELSGESPVKLEDGRLWLIVNGERKDITDLVDANTPYIYDSTDPDTGRRDYLVIGGTSEDYGWIEYHQLDGGRFAAVGENANKTYCVIDGVTYDFINDLTENQRMEVDEQIQKGLMDADCIYYEWKPWYQNAVERLEELGVQVPH